MRGINTWRVFERQKMLRKMPHLSIINILEPLSENMHIKNFKVQLNMENAEGDCNWIFLLFCSSIIDCTILYMDEKHITCGIKQNELQTKFSISFVCEKCEDHLRRPHAKVNIEPWCCAGGFNVITVTYRKFWEWPRDVFIDLKMNLITKKSRQNKQWPLKASPWGLSLDSQF